MMSEHDRLNVKEIVEGYGDWFNAMLLRYIATLDNSQRVLWALEFEEQVICLEGIYSAERQAFTPLCWKADKQNKQKIARVLRAIADSLDA